MTADANAGHVGNSGPAVMSNVDNVAPADRPTYDSKAATADNQAGNPEDFSSAPGAAARANGYPRLS